ncbi:thiopurine s-methyltransferase (TPMT) domain-containing protein [Sarocladium implicatum]|nr:thiopurine s-methyltransferase (TPMT) domain-containing protein [Sarocladium implicatum]
MTENAHKLVDTFSSAPLADHTSKWNQLYVEQYHPWDRAGPSLALSDLLAQRTDIIPSSSNSFFTQVTEYNSKRRKPTALVPGCGLGHDVLLLAARGYDVWGVDGSETALEGARKREEGVLERERSGELEEALRVVGDGVERGRVHWVKADYFAPGWEKGVGTEGSGTFDLIFDYTFLCALPLEARPLWAKRTTELLSHDPKSRLICLEFPIGKPLSESGPPWGLWPETYEALLAAPGEDIKYEEDGSGIPCAAAATRPKDEALHRLCLVKPNRTHASGTAEDGSVKDFISVWSR